jgi:hypothetical protein
MLRHSDLVGPDGGRSACPGELYRPGATSGEPHPRRGGDRPNKVRCRACDRTIWLGADGKVRLDPTRRETWKGAG